jgi:hypothetical protein
MASSNRNLCFNGTHNTVLISAGDLSENIIEQLSIAELLAELTEIYGTILHLK